MSIEGITNAQIIQRLKNVEGSSQTADKSGSAASSADEVNISSDAKLAQTLNRSMRAINETPEVREGKVEEVQQKLDEGFYESPEVLDEVADQVTDQMLGFT
ncbi:MAG: flagellar biosynthesis anti-sigma factor FlgM [bacterium]